MNRIAVVGVLVLAIAGCAKIAAVLDKADDLCIAEAKAHTLYMTFVAPFRPADKVANAVSFHAKVEKACAEGGTVDQIKKLIEAASAARN